ncbi:MAG TPA: nodulation protein NfeD [Bryobacteraceae bacterium]|jgi:membrane-bound serine protease (ClpP class)|nr:nodulation protein NfeD [Bryobacteraceae bacterium]
MKSILILMLAAIVAPAAPKVIAVNVDSVVHPITVEIITNAIDQASRENAAAILLRLNTPGGLLDATREINSRIVASRVPVIAYVTPSGGRAASAGFFILQAADVAAMAPGTNTGASSPVLLGEQMDPVMRSKVENDTSAWLRSLVTKRGRNAELAEQTVRQAKAFTEREALDNRLLDVIAPDEQRLLDELDGREIKRFDGNTEKLHTRGAEIVDYRASLRERLIGAIADPNTGYILLVLGALGIYVEFQAPGLIVPGVAGGILVLLGLSSLAVLPINWVGAALLVLAVALFVLEAKFASHGILGTGGAVAMVLGAVYLINGPPELRIRLSTALAVSLPFALITMFLVTLVIRARAYPISMGQQALVNQIAQARTALDPAGTVFVRGEHWDAVSSVPVEQGGAVRVVGVDGMILRVEPTGPPLGQDSDVANTNART